MRVCVCVGGVSSNANVLNGLSVGNTGVAGHTKRISRPQLCDLLVEVLRITMKPMPARRLAVVIRRLDMDEL